MSLGTYIDLTPGAGRESNNLLVIKYLFRSVIVTLCSNLDLGSLQS